MDDTSEKLARSDQLRGKRNWDKTPEQRMEEFWKLQKEMDAALRSNPKAYQEFLRRNYKKRAIQVPPDGWAPITRVE
jgi:hypothetical protein